MILRILGDVHGYWGNYLDLIKDIDHSIQLGDFGFNYNCLKAVDAARHKLIAGNHDNYEKVNDQFIHMQTGHWLGDFGIYKVPSFQDIFFVRGGYSIDWRYRISNQTWFEDEELTYTKMSEAIEIYQSIKPNFVITHECPAELIAAVFGPKIWDGELVRPSNTAKMLDAMWNSHSPTTWIFGHHHKKLDITIRGTNFICLPELGFMDFQI